MFKLHQLIQDEKSDINKKEEKLIKLLKNFLKLRLNARFIRPILFIPSSSLLTSFIKLN
jgi:hypothetical protein